MDASADAEVHVDALLADLASEYERSRRFLSQLEDSLKVETTTTFPVLSEESEDEGTEQEDMKESDKVPSGGVSGLKQKIARLFQRRSTEKRDRGRASEEVTGRRALAVVSLVAGDPDDDVFPMEVPKRGPSFCSQSRPSFQRVSQAQHPRMSLELRPQCQPAKSDNPEAPGARRESTCNLAALHPGPRRPSMEVSSLRRPSMDVAAMRRGSAEQSSFTGARAINVAAALSGSSLRQQTSTTQSSTEAPLSPTAPASSSVPPVLQEIAPQPPAGAPPLGPRQPRAGGGVHPMMSTALAPDSRRRSISVRSMEVFTSSPYNGGPNGTSPFLTTALPACNLMSPGAIGSPLSRSPGSLPSVSRAQSFKTTSVNAAASAVAGLRTRSLTAAAWPPPALVTPVDAEDAASASSAAALSPLSRQGDTTVSSSSMDRRESSSTQLGRMTTGSTMQSDTSAGSSSQLMSMPMVNTPMRGRSVRSLAAPSGGAARLIGSLTTSGMASVPNGGGAALLPTRPNSHSSRLTFKGLERESGGMWEAEGSLLGRRESSGAHAFLPVAEEGPQGAAFKGTLHVI